MSGQLALWFVIGFACGVFLMDWLYERKRRRFLAETDRKLAAAQERMRSRGEWRSAYRPLPPPQWRHTPKQQDDTQ